MGKAKKVIFISGTWSDAKPDHKYWWQFRRDTLATEVVMLGFELITPQFRWNSKLMVFGWVPWPRKNHWKNAGQKLLNYCRANKAENAVICSHSHGGQIVGHAIAAGLRPALWISLAMPYRPSTPVPPDDVRRINIVGTRDKWVHLGQIGNGRFDFDLKGVQPDTANRVLRGETHHSVVEVKTWNKWSLWDYLGDVI